MHDLGGPVGLSWALHYPGRVPKLIILNTLIDPETWWAVKLFRLALRTPVLRDCLVSPKGIVGFKRLVVDEGLILPLGRYSHLRSNLVECLLLLLTPKEGTSAFQ